MKSSWVFTLLMFTIISCSSNKHPEFEYSGGALHVALDNEPSTFISRNVDDAYSAEVLYQVMECLVSFDPKDLSVVPKIAKSWEISPDGLSYEFVIRKGILFHPHEVFGSEKERELTVEDVKKTIELICSKGETGSAGTAFSFVFEKYLNFIL